MLLALGLASVPATFFVARPSATFSVPPIEIGRFFISSDGDGLKTPSKVCIMPPAGGTASALHHGGQTGQQGATSAIGFLSKLIQGTFRAASELDSGFASHRGADTGGVTPTEDARMKNSPVSFIGAQSDFHHGSNGYFGFQYPTSYLKAYYGVGIWDEADTAPPYVWAMSALRQSAGGGATSVRRFTPYSSYGRFALAMLQGANDDDYTTTNMLHSFYGCADAAIPAGLPQMLSSRMLFYVLLFATLTPGQAVTCYRCYDQCPGCVGDDTCPFFTRTQANQALLSGAALAAGAATAVSLLNLLPLKFLRVLTRGVLDSLRTIHRRPAAGTPVDLTTLTEAQLLDAVTDGTAESQDAIREIATRMPGATQAEVQRLSAMQNTLTNLEKVGGNIGGAGVASITGQLLGAFTFAYAQAAMVVRVNTTNTVATLTQGEGSEAGEKTKPLHAKLIRPTSMAEFADFLTSWLLICHATGLADVLILGAFLRDVVYDTMSLRKLDWTVAHELFLVYVEHVETTSDASTTIANVYSKGAQDTFMQQATARAAEHFKSRIFRPSGTDPNGTNGGGDGKKWNGSWNGKASTCCITFNLGRKDHPASALTESGSCRHNHICDAWVTDKGPKGQCGGKHPRVKCDNPNKCDKPV